MKRPDWKIWLRDAKECKRWLDQYTRKNVLRKRGDQSVLHLQKTNRNLLFAGWIAEKNEAELPALFGEAFHDWVVTVSYYAIYHAALALVNKEGYESKSHAAVLCFLIYHNYHLKMTFTHDDIELVAGSLAKEDIEVIGSAKEMREKACYDVHVSFEQEIANQVREQAIEFSMKVKAMLG